MYMHTQCLCTRMYVCVCLCIYVAVYYSYYAFTKLRIMLQLPEILPIRLFSSFSVGLRLHCTIWYKMKLCMQQKTAMKKTSSQLLRSYVKVAFLLTKMTTKLGYRRYSANFHHQLHKYLCDACSIYLQHLRTVCETTYNYSVMSYAMDSANIVSYIAMPILWYMCI